MRGLLLVVAGCISSALAQPAAAPVIASFHELEPSLTKFETLWRNPLADTRTLVVIRGRMDDPPDQAHYDAWLRNDYIGLFLEQDGGTPARLAIFQNDAPGTTVKVERVDRDSLILSRASQDYGVSQPSLKLFLDLRARKLIRKVAFEPVAVEQLVEWDGGVYAVAPRAGLVARLRPGRPVVAAAAEREQALTMAAAVRSLDPKELLPDGIPQSSHADLMRARGDDVRANVTGTDIDESAGPMQLAGNRVWFGKTFYDGEGSTGVGAIGAFDRATRQFTFISPPELVKWSVSALLVEGDAIWAGLMRRPEGAEYSGGLLRYDLAAKTSSVISVKEVILTILRAGDALYLGSSNGVYVLRGGKPVHYVLEPAPDGRYGIY
jgi:hypothetical protein